MKDPHPRPHPIPHWLAATLLAAGLLQLPLAVAQEAAPPPAAAETAQTATGDAPPQSAVLLGPVRAALAAGDLATARVTLRRLLREHPNDPEVLVQMADLDLLLRNGGPAEVVLKRAIDNGLPRERALTRLGESYLLRGQPQRVLDELAPPASDPRAAADLLAVQARASLALGRAEAAERFLKEALTRDPNNLAALTGQGYVALAAGDTEAARAALARAITAHPGAACEALALHAELEQQAGRLAEAEAGYTAALEIAPEQWFYRFKRALARIDLGRPDDAERDLDQVEGAVPAFIGLSLGRGALALARGEPEKALDALETYLAAVPQDTPVFGLAAQAAARAGDQGRLKALAERLRRQAPGSPGPALVSAQALLQAGDGPGALEAIGPAANLGKTDPAVALLYVQVLRLAKRDDAAERALAEAVGRFPDHAGLTLEDARRLSREGADTDALAAVDRVLKKTPGNLAALALRSKLLLDLKRYDAALQDAQALADAAPTRPDGYRDLAVIRLARNDPAQGDRAAAREALVQALERPPTTADLAVALARLEVESGNRQAGLDRYAQALAADPNNTQAMAGLARLEGSGAGGAGGADLLERMQSALARDPRNAALRAELIAALLARAHLEEATRVADETPLEQAQDGPFALMRARAVAYLDGGRPADALRLLGVMGAQAPESARAETDYLTARAQAALGDARARDAFLAGWRLDAETPLAGAVLGQVLPLLKDNRQRDALARKMERLHPGHRTTAMLQAMLAAARGDRADAAKRWGAIFEKAPDSPEVFRPYLAALLAAGQHDTAGRTGDAWIARHPEDWLPSLMLANDLAQRDRLAEAAPHYQRVLRLDPNNVLALNNLALHLAKTDPAAARDHAELALRLRPRELQVMDTAGTVRLAAGDTAGAVDLLRQAHATAPTDPAIALHLAQALAAQGDTAAALDLLRPVVTLKFPEQPAARDLLARLERQRAAAR